MENTKMDNNEKKTMTLLELQKYLDSKSNHKFCFTYENNNTHDINIQANFHKVYVSPYYPLCRVVFYDTPDDRPMGTNSNYLDIYCIKNVTVETLYNGCDVLTLTSTVHGKTQKYVIIDDYEN